MRKMGKTVRLLIAAAVMFLFVSGLAIATEGTGKVNINSATVKELQQVKGVGKTLAERIVAYREESGPFRNLEDVKKVKGIGKSTFEKIKDQISLGDDKPQETKK